MTMSRKEDKIAYQDKISVGVSYLVGCLHMP